MTTAALPETGFVRMKQLVGDPKHNIPPIIPVSDKTIRRRVAEGSFPKPEKLSKMVTVWRVEDIRAWIAGKWSAGA